MKEKNNSRLLKIMVIISTVMLMMFLCGCRTRITNNTEVSQTISDDSGIMSDSYQQRRDELGIPVAEAPLFKGSGSDDEEYSEDDEYYDEEYDEDDEYYDEEDEYEDDEDEEDEEDDDTSTTSTTPSTTTPSHRTVYPSRPSTVIRRPSTTVTTHPQVRVEPGITVTLDLNCKDAKCSSSAIAVKKGSTYGTLPEPVREGYDFAGWYTAKEGGNKVTSKTKVKKDKAHTLYAHWKEKVIEKKTYTVTFDGNGGEDEVTLDSTEITVEEDGTYGDMPLPKRDKYTFLGWFTDPAEDGGTQVTSDTKITENADQTLYAHWEYDPYTWWDGEFSKAVNEIDESSAPDFIIEGGDSTEEKLLTSIRCRKADSGTAPRYIVKFIKNYSEEKAAEEAKAVHEQYTESAPDAVVVIVSDIALKGSNEEQLLYKMMLRDTLYDKSSEETDKASADLLAEGTAVDKPYKYTADAAE